MDRSFRKVVLAHVAARPLERRLPCPPSRSLAPQWTVWHDLVEWHDRTLRALFSEHGGEEIDHAGDGFLVAFPDPRFALACAVAIQQALAEHRRHHGFAPSVRIGVHRAEAIRVGRGYRGKGIHAAARIGAIAIANEILASRETAEAGRFAFTELRVADAQRIVGTGRGGAGRLGMTAQGETLRWTVRLVRGSGRGTQTRTSRH